MIKIGRYNDLVVARIVDFGAYLTSNEPKNSRTTKESGESKEEVLLPKRYLDDDIKVGDTIRVFVYTDSEDRPVATTETPFAVVGEFAFLQTIQVNRVGAFMDWGLQKNLLVPFKEQKIKMFPGGIYLVYVYLDHNTNRVVASARIEKFLGNVLPEYSYGQEVDALIYARNEIGYQVIVDNLHRGMIYLNEVYHPLEIGQSVKAYVKNVRAEDGKIDLSVTPPGTLGRIEKIAAEIMQKLTEGELTITDKSSPDEIKAVFECSKKDFKKAVGYLYKEKKISVGEDGTLSLA